MGCGKADKSIEQNKDNNNNQQNNNEQTNKVDTEGKVPMVFVLAGQSNTEGNTQFDDDSAHLPSGVSVGDIKALNVAKKLSVKKEKIIVLLILHGNMKAD